MSELVDALVARLAADAALTAAPPAGQGFTVLNRWPKPDGPGATPEAFTGPRLKRTVVVLEPGEAAHPSPRPGRDVELWDSFPFLYLFAEAHAAGKAALEAADARIRTLLHGWAPVLPSGERPTVESTTTRTPAREDESWPGVLRTERRYRVTGTRQLLASA